jgi:hypothetical protein
LSGIVETEGQSEDFALSDDWSKVTQFEEGPANDKDEAGPWSSTTWCLEDKTYEKCGQKQTVQPPDPPLLKELRNPE